MLVQGNALLYCCSFRDCDTDTENGIGTKFSLIWGSIEFDEEVINILLRSDPEARTNEGWANYVVDVGYCL
jgi:hypothetical protein